jgi:membrane protein implicated in regulation of membrane protease activity
MIDLVGYLWILWLVLILIFIVIELLTLDLTFLMIAVGSVGGLVGGLVGAPWWLQILITAAMSTLLLFSIRPGLLRRLARGADLRPTNVAGLIGLSGVTLTELGVHGGQVKLSNGETWTARLNSFAVPPSGATPPSGVTADGHSTASTSTANTGTNTGTNTSTARSSAVSSTLASGSSVVVTAIEGSTAVVAPSGRKTEQ